MIWTKRILHGCASNGRYLLVAGLVVAILIEPLAHSIRPFIAELVVLMLMAAAFRVGLRAAIGARRDLQFSLIVVLLLQVAVPIILLAIFQFIGWKGVLPTALVLMAAGASISGAPNLSVLSGGDPAPALRLMVIGTALLPLTVLPVFWLLPGLGDGAAVLIPALRLMLAIAVAAIVGFAIRAYLFSDASLDVIKSADGISAILMFVIVIGLMSAVGPALREAPGLLGVTLLTAFAINFGLQLAGYLALSSRYFAPVRTPISIVAGNRNIALFLTALPTTITDPMLLFIGCYQIPMYLTPILLGRLYASKTPRPDA